MAAKNARVTCPVGSWTRLTDAAGTTGDVSVMLASYNTPVYLQATATDSAPSGTDGPLELLQYGDGWSEATILEKFPGVATAAFLWARPRTTGPFIALNEGPAVVSISHG